VRLVGKQRIPIGFVMQRAPKHESPHSWITGKLEVNFPIADHPAGAWFPMEN
jgi:hypothetical protein